jgi:hypothetical protein
MPAAGTIHSQNHLGQPGRQQRTKTPKSLPQLHQLRDGDVAPLEVEELIGSAIPMQSDLPSIATDVESHLRAVVVRPRCGGDGRVWYFLPCQPAERVADQCTSALQLGLIVEVLGLAPAALVQDVMRAARLHPLG